MNIRAVGIPWYREEDWQEIRRVMIDAAKLHDRYEEWLKAASQLEKRIRDSGQIAERVYIDPKEFPAWCGLRNLNVDAEARTFFANEFVARKYRHSN
jgi:hypothetical protein